MFYLGLFTIIYKRIKAIRERSSAFPRRLTQINYVRHIRNEQVHHRRQKYRAMPERKPVIAVVVSRSEVAPKHLRLTTSHNSKTISTTNTPLK